MSEFKDKLKGKNKINDNGKDKCMFNVDCNNKDKC